MRELLRDTTVLLAATPAPPPVEGDPWERAARVEEATLSLARAILAHAGRIVMAWDDALSPLVAQVALEQQPPRQVEQSVPEDPRERTPRFVAYRLVGAGPSAWDVALTRLGTVQVRDVPRDPGERRSRRQHTAPSRASVLGMRRNMIVESAPRALIGLGGGADLGEMTELFAEHHPEMPVFVLETTSDAAAEQARRGAIAIDRQILDEHDRLFAELAASRGWERAEDEDVERVVPYPLVAQMLVERLAAMGGRRNR